MKSDEFVILVTGTSLLKKSEVWPDGDAPERPTAEDVAAVMAGYGDAPEVLVDWALLDDCDVEVYGPSTYALAFESARRTGPAERAAS